MAGDPQSRGRGRDVPQVVFDDFLGLASNLDPQDVPHGAAIHQVNVVASAPGELRVRAGTRLLRFDPIPPR